MINTNHTAGVVYESCIRSTDLAFEPGGFEGDNPGELKAAERRCARSFDNMRMSPGKLMRLLLGKEGEETLTVWSYFFGLSEVSLSPLAVGYDAGNQVNDWLRRGGVELRLAITPTIVFPLFVSPRRRPFPASASGSL